MLSATNQTQTKVASSDLIASRSKVRRFERVVPEDLWMMIRNRTPAAMSELNTAVLMAGVLDCGMLVAGLRQICLGATRRFEIVGYRAEIDVCIRWMLEVDLHETIDSNIIIIEEYLFEYRLTHHEESW